MSTTTARGDARLKHTLDRWEPDPACILCKRRAGSLTVVLLRIGNVSAVAVQDGYAPWDVATVPADKSLDAFAHPYLYIAR